MRVHAWRRLMRNRVDRMSLRPARRRCVNSARVLLTRAPWRPGAAGPGHREHADPPPRAARAARGPRRDDGRQPRARPARVRAAAAPDRAHAHASTRWPRARACSPGRRPRTCASWPQAFNDMLERLEDERRDSARRAVARAGGRAPAARARAARRARAVAHRRAAADRSRRSARPRPRDLEEAREGARRSLDDVRRIARDLRPDTLVELGLPSALNALATRFTRQSGVPVDRQLDARPAGARRGRRGRALPRRAGGADQRRPSRRRAPRRRSRSSTRTARVTLHRRRRRRAASRRVRRRRGARHHRNARARAARPRAPARRRPARRAGTRVRLEVPAT